MKDVLCVAGYIVVSLVALFIVAWAETRSRYGSGGYSARSDPPPGAIPPRESGVAKKPR